MSRLYFETQVKKVKKKEKEWTPDMCPCCGAKREAEKPLGNWVNGENLDKIKFPCFCSYRDNDYIERCYGMMIKNQGEYKIIPLEKQYRALSYPFDENLAYFIGNWDIHILKGKIIIYEGERNE